MVEKGVKQLENRNDVAQLVRAFYAKIRQDELLGPIFNESIQDWEPHLEKLTDFWEGNLFFFVKTPKSMAFPSAIGSLD